MSTDDTKPPRTQERRRGFEDFAALVRDASTDIQKAVDERINNHADESRAGIKRAEDAIAGLHETVLLNQKAASDIAEMVRPLPGEIAAVKGSVETLHTENERQWEEIRTQNQAQRELELKVAREEGRKEAEKAAAPAPVPAPPSPTVSFWTGTNGRIVLAIIFVVTISLCTLLLHQAGTTMPSLKGLLS